jgi:general stress protein CsbA
MIKKTFSLFTGALLLGFGIGTIILKEFELSSIVITLITVVSLIIGGFLIALSLTMKKKEKIIEEKKDENQVSDNNSEPGV